MTTTPHRRRFTLSVRTRIVAVITLVAAVAMTVVGFTVYIVERTEEIHAINDRLHANLASARFLVAEGDGASGGWESSTAALRTVVQRMSPDDHTGAVGIIDDRVALVPGLPLDVDLDRSDFVAAVVSATTGDDAVIRTFQARDATWRYLAVPIAIPGSPAPERVIFTMAYDVDAELSILNGTARLYLLASGIALIVIAGVAWFVAGRLLRPLRQMRETARRVSAQSLSERIPTHGRDDVSELAQTMNDMLDRLAEALHSQRRLLGDVGHELKTPLTIVRGYVEVMDVDDPDDARETQRLAIDEIDRMGGLVHDLTGAASLYGPNPIHPRPVDTADLVAQIARKAAAISGAEVVTGPVADVAATLDASRITQAMLQLAQNAVTHGGGWMELSCRSAGGMLEFSVRDRGPGVPAEAREAVFERFARGTSATEGRGSRGSGLGLDIVRLIAQAHGGTAAVRAADGVGSVFTITVPQHPAAAHRSEGDDDALDPDR